MIISNVGYLILHWVIRISAINNKPTNEAYSSRCTAQGLVYQNTYLGSYVNDTTYQGKDFNFCDILWNGSKAYRVATKL